MSAIALLPILLFSSFCWAEEPQPLPTCPSVVDSRLPQTITPLSYALQLEPDLTNFKFKGEANITINVKQDVPCIILNAKNLTFTAPNVTVTLINGSGIVNVTNVEQIGTEFVTISVNPTLQKGKNYMLDIKYSGTLNDEKRGFYRSKYLMPDASLKYIATTHFEPTGARLAFPCWDEPAFKATFKISLIHLSNYTAISNMKQDGDVKPIKDTNKVATSFVESKSMSTYLVAFVVSDYNKTENSEKTMRVWTKAHAINQTEYALKVGEDIIKQLDEYTGIKYLLIMTKMDQISIKDFTAGAMENWGLVTYRETALLYEPNVTTTRSKQSIATIIAHEFAHQWFGNLVSPKWWEFIWLNEGFANYFQYYIMDKLEPDWRLMEVYVTEPLQGQAFVTDAGENTRPINKNVSTPSEISALFDRIAYEKAGSVIRMMSHILTPEVFQKGLKDYLNKMKFSNADDDDLLDALNAAANTNWEGKNLTEIMTTWLDKPGYPVVNVVKSGTDLLIKQERFTLHESSDNTKWWVPITYAQEADTRAADTKPVAWLNPNVNETKISNMNKDGWVIVNVNQTGFYRVNYNKENWDQLTKYLKSDNYSKISPLGRAQLIDDAFALARTSRLNYSVALSLTSYLNKDTDYIPWNTAFRNLNFLNDKLQRTENYPIFQLYLRYLLKKVTKDVKYEASTKDSHTTRLLKRNALKWGCKAEEQECTKYAVKEFNAWVSDPVKKSLDVDLKNNIICVGLRTADEKKWNKTLEILVNSTQDEDERNALLPLMGCSGSPVILKKLLLSSLQQNPKVNFNIAVEAVISDHKDGVDIVLDFITTEQERIKKLDNAEEKIKGCIESLGSTITDEQQFLKLTLFSAKAGAKPDLLHNAVMKGQKNLEWMSNYSQDIGKWLKAHEATFSSATTLVFSSFLTILSILVTQFY